MDVQTDARLLRNIEGYLIELVCSVKSMEEANLLAEALVSVQDALRDLEQKPRFAARSNRECRRRREPAAQLPLGGRSRWRDMPKARDELGTAWPMVGFPKALMHTRILEVRSWRSSDLFGRWSLTALVINAIVGASIFGLLGNHSVTGACGSARCAFGSLSRLPGRVVSK